MKILIFDFIFLFFSTFFLKLIYIDRYLWRKKYQFLNIFVQSERTNRNWQSEVHKVRSSWELINNHHCNVTHSKASVNCSLSSLGLVYLFGLFYFPNSVKTHPFLDRWLTQERHDQSLREIIIIMFPID